MKKIRTIIAAAVITVCGASAASDQQSAAILNAAKGTLVMQMANAALLNVNRDKGHGDLLQGLVFTNGYLRKPGIDDTPRGECAAKGGGTRIDLAPVQHLGQHSRDVASSTTTPVHMFKCPYTGKKWSYPLSKTDLEELRTLMLVQTSGKASEDDERTRKAEQQSRAKQDAERERKMAQKAAEQKEHEQRIAQEQRDALLEAQRKRNADAMAAQKAEHVMTAVYTETKSTTPGPTTRSDAEGTIRSRTYQSDTKVLVHGPADYTIQAGSSQQNFRLGSGESKTVEVNAGSTVTQSRSTKQK